MIITLARNAVTGRYHTFGWYCSPTPSSDLADSVQRHKTKFHHTIGFPTEDEAKASIPELVKTVRDGYGSAEVRVEKVWEMSWEENEVPATVTWMMVEGAYKETS